MLEINNASLTLGESSDSNAAGLGNINLRFPRPHFGAILGPSGCGKSTLLKLVAGLIEQDDGQLLWDGRDLAQEEDIDPADLGYVPQFGIVHERLTIRESLEYALRLRVAGLTPGARADRIDRTLEQVGLTEIADREGRLLSGGQKRRQALAMEIVSQPSLLLCDEVTSGLDPQSEEEIVKLLRSLTREQSLLVLSVTHSLKHIELYDSVTILREGCVLYSGRATGVMRFFDVGEPDDLFPQLNRKTVDYWTSRFERYEHFFSHDAPPLDPSEDPMRAFSSAITPDKPLTDSAIERIEHETVTVAVPKLEVRPANSNSDSTASSGLCPDLRAAQPENSESSILPRPDNTTPREASTDGDDPARFKQSDAALAPAPRHQVPGAVAQFGTLLSRRIQLFFRDPGQVYLQLALLVLFPSLVVPFALNGLPQIQNMTLAHDVDVLDQIRQSIAFTVQTSEVGSLISGLVMFQVVLVTLMGSNNGAREIVTERTILEKEKLAGLNSFAYLASKAAFLSALVFVQSLWMTIVVKFVCGFPGSLIDQAAMLILANGALTAICLAISAWSRTGEQSSLIAIYFVGFQLPLSGAVLALPELLGNLTRPIISAYWSWSGYLQTMSTTNLYDAADAVAATPFSTLSLCYWVLIWHIVIGLVAAFLGAARSRWE